MKKLMLVLVILCTITLQASSEKVDDRVIEAEKVPESSELLQDLEKRYRLYGKRNFEAESTGENNYDLSSEMDKRYRLYGKRLSDDVSDLEKRYRLYGKRYRLYGKRYRLYGKRNYDESDESSDIERKLLKRYRLIGNDTGKRFRLMR